jgi:hypothetical protein
VERSFYIVLANHNDIQALKHKLPITIARCWTTYILDTDIMRPSPCELKASRTILPEPPQSVFDNTAYKILLPGVMIHGKAWGAIGLHVDHIWGPIAEPYWR